MAEQPYLDPGFDPTALPDACVTRANLLAMVQMAQPVAGVGFVIQAASAPDAVGYPALANFLWVNTSTGEIRRWNGSSWVTQALGGTFSGTNIVVNSMPINRLDVTGIPEYYAIRVQAGGGAPEWVAPANLFQNGILPLAKLVNAGAWPNKSIIAAPAAGGAWTAQQLTYIINKFDLPNDAIPLRSLDISGGARKLAQVNGTGTVWQAVSPVDIFNAAELPQSKLDLATASSSPGAIVTLDATNTRSFRVTATTNITTFALNNLPSGGIATVAIVQDGTGGHTIVWPSGIEWVGGTAPGLSTNPNGFDLFTFYNNAGTLIGEISRTGILSYDSGQIAWPAANTATTLVHNLGYVPQRVTARMICVLADGTYDVDDEVDLATVDAYNTGGGDYSHRYFTVIVNETNIVVARRVAGGQAGRIVDKDGTGIMAITPANWEMIITAS